MKQERFTDGNSRGSRVCADLFILANVGGLFRFCRHQRPDFRDLVAFDVKQTGAFRRVKPLVQTGAEIIAAQVLLLEIKLRE